MSLGTSQGHKELVKFLCFIYLAIATPALASLLAMGTLAGFPGNPTWGEFIFFGLTISAFTLATLLMWKLGWHKIPWSRKDS